MNCERFEKGDFACVIKTLFQDHIAPMRLNIRKIHFNFFFFFFWSFYVRFCLKIFISDS